MFFDNYYVAKTEGRAPWDSWVREGMTYIVFRDRYPVTAGHLLFIPKNLDPVSVMSTLYEAWSEGRTMVEQKKCDAFNIGMNMGEAAGQTVMYPHVHLIPRCKGDCEDPVGGVRGVIPGQANYHKEGYRKIDSE
jgi:diadenosine tetraphosphate (Ap4A) HIT family hydrolase